MREWCGCGAAIYARKKDVLQWREQHTCPDRPEAPAVTDNGTASTEINYDQTALAAGFTRG